MRLCRSPCRSSSVRFCRSSRRYAAALRCLQFGRLQLADDWTLSELQSWPPPLATSHRSQRGGLRGVPRGRGDGKSRPPASPVAARADHGGQPAATPPRTLTRERQLQPKPGSPVACANNWNWLLPRWRKPDFDRNADFAGLERTLINKYGPPARYTARYTECPSSRCRCVPGDSPTG